MRLLAIILSISYGVNEIFASFGSGDIGFKDQVPNGTILTAASVNAITLFSIIQAILLKIVLPIVVVGGGLYIAYELFGADGDETKMKKAWKSVTYTAVGLICIAVSYAFVSIVSRISF